MPLTDWNRYRNDTYRDNRDAELPYIRTPIVANADEAAAGAPKPDEPELPSVYSEYKFVNKGVHMQQPKGKDEHGCPWPAKLVPCEFWICANTSGKYV